MSIANPKAFFYLFISSISDVRNIIFSNHLHEIKLEYFTTIIYIEFCASSFDLGLIFTLKQI